MVFQSRLFLTKALNHLTGINSFLHVVSDLGQTNGFFATLSEIIYLKQGSRWVSAEGMTSVSCSLMPQVNSVEEESKAA